MSAKHRNQQSYRRPSKNWDPRPRILIVSEGKETECNYFNALRNLKKLSVAHVEVIGPDKAGGTHPRNLVEYIKTNKKKYKDFDEKWCVFDRDKHENIEEAFVTAKDNKINIAFSSPCFEIWLLLHFQDKTAFIDRHKVIGELKAHIPHYEKSMRIDGDSKLMNATNRNAAIQRAKSLEERHRNNNTPITDSNPYTDVYKLVEKLLKIG